MHKHTMGVQLQQLLAAIAINGSQHVQEMERDLAQTNSLLEEAIRKLGNSFLAIHEGLTAQQALFSDLKDGQSTEQLLKLQAAINQHINAAITGLQFQDMTSQLITKMSKHIAELQDVFAVVDRPERQIMAQAEDAAILIMLANMNTELARQKLVFDDVSRKVVTQQHLECGDIELF